MTIGDSFKAAINNAFVYTIFRGRKSEVILKTLKTKIHGANTCILPPMQGFKVERIDETHDKVTFAFDDYHFDGIITWKPCADQINFVFVGIE